MDIGEEKIIFPFCTVIYKQLVTEMSRDSLIDDPCIGDPMCNLTDVQVVRGRSQPARIDSFFSAGWRIVSNYDRAFAGIFCLFVPSDAALDRERHLYP